MSELCPTAAPPWCAGWSAAASPQPQGEIGIETPLYLGFPSGDLELLTSHHLYPASPTPTSSTDFFFPVCLSVCLSPHRHTEVQGQCLRHPGRPCFRWFSPLLLLFLFLPFWRMCSSHLLPWTGGSSDLSRTTHFLRTVNEPQVSTSVKGGSTDLLGSVK